MRKWFERILLLTACAFIGAWGWSTFGGYVFQRYEDYAFEQSLRGAGVSPTGYLSRAWTRGYDALRQWIGLGPSGTAVQPEEPGTPSRRIVGRLEIPRLRLRAIVMEGISERVLGVALGHIPGTALPGQPGNAGIAGHRDTLFSALKDIDHQDLIVVQTLKGRYHYRVESTSVVEPSQVSVLRGAGASQLTLVTCFPFHYVGPAPKRFIVRARLVGSRETNGDELEHVSRTRS